MFRQVAHGLLRINCSTLSLLLILPIGQEFLLIVLLLSIIVRSRYDTFILMLLVNHFELRDGFLGLVDALLAEVALPVYPSCFLSIVLSLAPHIVCSHELLHDFIVILLLSTSLLIHFFEIGSVLVKSGLSIASIIK